MWKYLHLEGIFLRACLVLAKNKNFPVGLVAQVCNPITQNQEGGLQVLGQPELRAS